MKRDFELIRTLLLKIEEEMRPGDWYEPIIENVDESMINYHIKMLRDKGYIDAKDLSSKDGISFVVTGMTMEGHDYLDTVRNNTVWEKTKKKVIDKSLDLTFDVVKTVAGQIINQTLGLS